MEVFPCYCIHTCLPVLRSEACSKYASLCQRRPEVCNSWATADDDCAVRSSYSSDMSFDDDSPRNYPRGSHQAHHPLLLHQPTPSMRHPPESSISSVTPLLVQRSTTVKLNKDEEERAATATESASSSHTGQPARRLSVQDRINLFENRQKEGSTGSGGGKPIVGKSFELWRLSSDMSTVGPAVEKAPVLKRWSAVSDMSIDPGNDKDRYNDSESPVCTPSSSLISKSCELEKKKSRNDFTDTATAPTYEVVTGLKDDQSDFHSHLPDFLGQVGEVNVLFADKEQSRLGGQIAYGPLPILSFLSRTDYSGVNDQAAPHQAPSVLTPNKAEGRLRDLPFTNKLSRRKADDYIGVGSGKDACEAYLSRYKGVETCGGEEGTVVGRKDSASTEKQPRSFAKKVEDSGVQSHSLKFQRQGSGAEQMKKSLGKREDNIAVSRNSKLVPPSKMSCESQQTSRWMPTASFEQLQRGRLVKGNQELNDELQMKANELEKLYAEHKRRVPADQALSNQRSKPIDVQMGLVAKRQYRKTALEVSPSQLPDKNVLVTPIGSSRYMVASSLGKLVDNQDYGAALEHNFSKLGFSDDFRGKFYCKYMRKRDAKLREEWGLKRFEKEAKMRAMHDSLERSRTEMKEKFEGSTERQDSRNHSGKPRTFSIQSKMKREQQPIDYLQCEEDEVFFSELSEYKLYGRDRLPSKDILGDDTSRSIQIKKLNKNLPSSSAVPAPGSSVKASNPGPGRQRTQLKSPLAQSVPNFCDFRKENTKPSSGGSKTATRSQVRNYAHSRCNSEEVLLVKEEKPWWCHSLKKFSSSSIEFKDLAPVDSDSVVLTPLKYNKEQTKQILDKKFPKGVEREPKHFLMKRNSNGLRSGSGISKLKSSMAVEILKDGDEAAKLHCEQEDSMDLVKDEDVEEFETSMTEDFTNMDTETPRLNKNYVKFGQFGTENGDAVRSTTQAESAFVAELPSVFPSTFCTVGSVQNSPGESPSWWSSRMHLSFSYQHETSRCVGRSPNGKPCIM